MAHAFSAAATTTAAGGSMRSGGRATLRAAHAERLSGWDGWQNEVRLSTSTWSIQWAGSGAAVLMTMQW